MPLFLLTTLLSIALVFGGQIRDEAKNLKTSNPPSTPKIEEVQETQTPTPLPTILQQEEVVKEAANNTSVDNSQAQTPSSGPTIVPELTPTPTEILNPEVIDNKGPQPESPPFTPFPCTPDFERGNPAMEMPCIF